MSRVAEGKGASAGGRLQSEQKHQARVRRETEDVGVLFGAGRHAEGEAAAVFRELRGKRWGVQGLVGAREWDTEGAGLP